jgi:hypothetical protein
MTDEDLRKTIADIRQASQDVDMVKSMLETAADEIERLQNELKGVSQSDTEPVRAFAKAVLHGDDEHKAWLTEAAEAFISNKPLPSPRGKGTAPPHPDAEPVAWRWRWYSDPPDLWNFADNEFHSELMTIEPLYTARPHPDSGSKL